MHALSLGELVHNIYFSSAENITAGIYKNNVCVVVPFPGVQYQQKVKGILHNTSCINPAPPLQGLLANLGFKHRGVRIRTVDRGEDRAEKHEHAQYIEVCPHGHLPARDGGPDIEVCRGVANPRRKHTKVETEATEVEMEATEVIDHATNAPALSLPATPVSQPAIPRLVPASSEWKFFQEPLCTIRWSVDAWEAPYLSEELPFPPVVTYAAAHATEMAVAAWRESFVPFADLGEM